MLDFYERTFLTRGLSTDEKNRIFILLFQRCTLLALSHPLARAFVLLK
jgi:hypothetical protein